MKTTDTTLNHMLRVGVLLLSGLALMGCEKVLGIYTYKWTEDVRLDYGSIVTIKRRAMLYKSTALGGGPLSAKELAAKIVFTGPLKSLPTWRFPRKPLLLYKDPKTLEWVVVASASSSTEVYKNVNQSPYWEYRAKENGEWREVPISPENFGRSANLFFGYERITTDHISVKDTDELIVNPLVHGPFRKITKKW